MTFSVLTVAGTEWVCEQLSESQCKPLYPKVSQGWLCFSKHLFSSQHKYQDKAEVGPGQTERDGEVEYRGNCDTATLGSVLLVTIS